MKTQAVSYLRVSGKGQVEGDEFPRQRQAIATYAKRHGLEVAEEYRDEGLSGTRELDDRPGLAAVLDRVESNGIKVVLVERADRLARDLMIGEIILDQIPPGGRARADGRRGGPHQRRQPDDGDGAADPRGRERIR